MITNTYWEDKRRREEQKNGPEQRRRDAQVDVEADKRVAFVRALIAADATNTFLEMGAQLASIEPVANLGFPIP